LSLGEIGRDWELLARSDPLWAVYVRPEGKDGRWDVEEFLATGEDEVARAWRLIGVHATYPPGGVALDFGCGVGRLTYALAKRMDRVVGIDISPTMIGLARRTCSELPNVSFVTSDFPCLPFHSQSVDVVYSSLVLQHLPAATSARYLSEFLRILRPGGLAVIQVATRPRLSPRGLAFWLLPVSVTAFLQTRVLHYPAPMRMQAMPLERVHRLVHRAGGRILAEQEDRTYGGHWHYQRLVILGP
jgi:SAM-dependent methyltransferase